MNSGSVGEQFEYTDNSDKSLDATLRVICVCVCVVCVAGVRVL